MIVLDTHVLVWALQQDRRLGRRTRALIDRRWGEEGVAVAAISFWECVLLARRGRLTLPSAVSQWRRELLDAGLRELPLDGAIAARAVDLDGLGDDPADRFVAATAAEHAATLVTADARLLDWEHPLPRHDAST